MSTPFFDNMFNNLRKNIDDALSKNPEGAAQLEQLMAVFQGQDWSNPTPEKIAEMQQKLAPMMEESRNRNQQFMEYIRNFKPDNNPGKNADNNPDNK